jgi:hypothetical protein
MNKDVPIKMTKLLDWIKKLLHVVLNIWFEYVMYKTTLRDIGLMGFWDHEITIKVTAIFWPA